MNTLNNGGYACSKGSINRHIVEGVSAYEYFSPKKIIEDLLSYNDILKLDVNNVLKDASKLLELNDGRKSIIERVLYKYGKRLADVLFLLEHPTETQKANRPDYTEEDWSYLKSIKKIYLAGGLLNEQFSDIFKKALYDVFVKKDFSKEVIFLNNSSNLAIEGLSYKCSKDALLYDFGQTNVKRGSYINGSLLMKDSVKVNISARTPEEAYAMDCHTFILDILVKDLSNTDIDEVHMAISNYVNKGRINPAPWHYGILHLVDRNYQDFLCVELSRTLGRGIKVTLHHDTTSMGYSIKDKKNAILISLGTAFGVSYFE